MLTIPLFRPWRYIWDDDIKLAETMRRLDSLVMERQKGRQFPPPLKHPDEVIFILLALKFAKGKMDSAEFLEQKIKPLFESCVWPRWLLLEEALEQALQSGNLHLSALILRSQIEELDTLQAVATVVFRRDKDSWDSAVMADAILDLTTRVLPRLQTKDTEQFLENASHARTFDKRAAHLQQAFCRLNEYVHPNYGSHVLSVRPHDLKAAKVFIEAFSAIYETFLSLPWAKERDEVPEKLAQRSQNDSRDPFLVLAEDTIPELKTALKGTDDKVWDQAVKSFRHLSACQNNWCENQEWPTGAEAIQALKGKSIPSELWPEDLRTGSGQNRYAFLVAQEQRLAQDASKLIPCNNQCYDKERLTVLISGLNFAAVLTEYKLDSFARQAAHLINSQNVFGAALAVRSMLEHHALAVELSDKMETIWKRAETYAPNTPKTADAFEEAEKQLARVLAGSSDPTGVDSTWRTLWKETVRKHYNISGPVAALDEKQPGVRATYGYLSHIIHGTVGTGGDLLGTGGNGWKASNKPLAAQLTLRFASLCEQTAMMDRQAGVLIITRRLDVLRHDPAGLGEGMKSMRLPEGMKLKLGRDIFGSGSKTDPFRFRPGLLYHDAFYHYLNQERIDVVTRSLAVFYEDLAVDHVKTKDGREIYFLDDKISLA